jgi:hypothetical protein
MTIRVRIVEQQQQGQQQEQPPPPAKRQRTQEQGDSGATDHYTDIPAHSLVLRAWSPYFDKCLSGDWAESAERRVEVTVENVQELEDLQLLIKLSYSDSYTHDDDGALLAFDTRVRLGVRADALEFVDALTQLVESLPQGFEGAMTCLDDLPPALEAHPGMSAVRRRAVDVVTKGIEERKGKEEEEEAVRAGANALAKYLGPVAGMFQEGIDFLSLREEVKQLPSYAFKRLLMSEGLQLQLENETYYLLVSWLQRSPHAKDKKKAMDLFKDLAPVLRYHHMTPDFLGNIVSQSGWMKESGLLPSVLRSALGQRNASALLLVTEGVTRGKGDRGLPTLEASWEIQTSFTLEEVTALQSNKSIRKWCGLVAGYPAALGVMWDKDKDTLGAFLRVSMPAVDVVEGGPAAGVGLKFDLTLSPAVKKSQFTHFFTRTESCSYPNVFEKPWAEVVCEGSPHFPGGKLEIKATVQLALEEEE